VLLHDIKAKGPKKWALEAGGQGPIILWMAWPEIVA